MIRYILLLSSIIPIIAWGNQYTKIITLCYDIDEFQFYENRGITSINSSEFDLYFDSDCSLPALPGIPFSVLIGGNEEFLNFSYTSANDTTFNNINIAACREPQPTQAPIINPITPFPTFTSFYEAKIEYKGCKKMEHYKVLYFVAYPFEYNGRRQKLTLKQRYTLNISFMPDNNYQAPMVVQPNSIVSDNEIRHHIEQTAINGNEIDQYYPLSIYPTSGEIHADYEYIIVAPDWAASYFQPLIEWKIQKGIKAKVLTLSYIQNNYSGNTLQIKIKNALRDYYDGQYSGLKYAMLAGTDYLVPSQKCLAELHRSYRDTIQYTPCDLFYASFESMNWDNNGNGIYGEFTDSINPYPNINVTRIPINSGADASIFVNRILEYEKNPNTTNWINNILMCGNILNQYVYCDGSLNSDAYKAGKDIYDVISKYWTGSRMRLYDTYTDYPEGAEYEFTTAHLQSELEKGYKFVQVDTHGLPTSWTMETIDESSQFEVYGSENANLLNNTSYSIITTSACNTNDFSYSQPCLSREFMFNPNSGVIAYIGTSILNWTGTSTYYNKSYYRNLLKSSDNRFASAINFTKANVINLGWHSKQTEPYRWILFALNPVGDPEMPVYTSQPKHFEQLDINYCNNRLSIDAKTDGCRVCLMSINDNGSSYYKVLDNIRTAVFDDIINCDSLSLCITKPGYIPFVRSVTQSTYIQNETINENRHLVSMNTYIGSNVTANKTEGPVIIEGGAIDMCIGNGVLLKNNIEVKKGVTFEIK